MDRIPVPKTARNGFPVIETLLIAVLGLGCVCFLAFVLALLRTAARAERAAECQKRELGVDAEAREHGKRRSVV